MNNKILKLDDEHLKLYITKNQSLPKLLKNSGSMIIFHDEHLDNPEYTNNYIYLGNEHIASGWGFNNQKQKETTIKYLDELPSILSQLQELIEMESSKRSNDDNEILNNINNLVSKNSNIAEYGTNKNNLYFEKDSLNSDYYNINSTFNDKFYIKDLLSLFKSATYKDIEITNISQQYFVGFFNNQIFTLYNDIIVKNNICYVPYYSILYKHIISIEYQQNDSGGIRSAYISRYVSSSNINNNVYQSYKHNITNSDIESLLNNNENLSKINFITLWNNQYNINNNGYLLFDTDKELSIFKTFDAIISSTPKSKYKKFPLLENYNIYSTENIIGEYKISIDTLKIKPSYLFYYNDIINDSNINDFSQNQSYNFKSFDHNILITDNYIEFDIDFSSKDYHFMSFALPSKYIINNIKLIKQNKKYNITGLFKVINNVGLSLNPYEYNSYYINLPYNFYYMFTNLTWLKGTYKIIISITEDNINEYNIQVPQNLIDNNTGLYQLFENHTLFLKNDDFDSSHWNNGYCGIFINWLINNINNFNENIEEIYLNKVLQY